MNQNLNHPTIPVFKIINGHPIAINANTHAKLIFTLPTSVGLNFFKSKCHVNLTSNLTVLREVSIHRNKKICCHISILHAYHIC